MVTAGRPFRLTVGGPDAEYYAAYVQMNHRERPGVHFELALGQPWRWTGAGAPIDASLVDVLAAANYARIARQPGHWDVNPRAIHTAHEQAVEAALHAGDHELFERLRREQAAVAVTDLVDEEEAADRLEMLPTSLNDLRLWYRTICPPVLIAGETRTKWFWAREQFEQWQGRRPGKAWRRGQRVTFPRRECPECHRQVAAAVDVDAAQASLRRHKRPDGAWCGTTVVQLTRSEVDELRAGSGDTTSATA